VKGGKGGEKEESVQQGGKHISTELNCGKVVQAPKTEKGEGKGAKRKGTLALIRREGRGGGELIVTAKNFWAGKKRRLLEDGGGKGGKKRPLVLEKGKEKCDRFFPTNACHKAPKKKRTEAKGKNSPNL